jgi:hypothetical protein
MEYDIDIIGMEYDIDIIGMEYDIDIIGMEYDMENIGIEYDIEYDIECSIAASTERRRCVVSPSSRSRSGA